MDNPVRINFLAGFSFYPDFHIQAYAKPFKNCFSLPSLAQPELDEKRQRLYQGRL
jgi:hypothetical protein